MFEINFRLRNCSLNRQRSASEKHTRLLPTHFQTLNINAPSVNVWGNSCGGGTVCVFFFLCCRLNRSTWAHEKQQQPFSFSSASPVAGKQHKSLRVSAQETKYIQSAWPLCIDSHIINSGSLRAQTVVWLNSAGPHYGAEITVLQTDSWSISW